jgi:hypothetical protein
MRPLRHLERFRRRAAFALRWPLAMHWVVTGILFWYFPALITVAHAVSLLFALYCWWRAGHQLINTDEQQSPHRGERAPPLVTRDGKNKELWSFAAARVSLSSWLFYYLFLRTELMYDKWLSIAFFVYQRLNTSSRASAGESFKRIAISELVLETSLVMFFSQAVAKDVDGTPHNFLVFEFGDVFFPMPSGDMAEYRKLRTIIDMENRLSTTTVDGRDADPVAPSGKVLCPSEAGFVLQYFLSHGAHPPVHVYGSWVSRVPEVEQDECTFWMSQCSNAMIVEAKAIIPTISLYEDLFWSLPESNYHVRGLNANLRYPTEHRQLANAKLIEESRYCQFIMALRGATFRAFAKHGVKYDPELLLAAITHSVDHRGMWVHRIPSCYEWHGINLLRFWELHARAPLALFVDTKMSSAPLPYLQDIYESMAEVDRCLADAMHWAISW